MKKINVIDLDGTLINYDTSRQFVFSFLKRPNSFLKFFILVLLRKLHIYDRKTFFKKIILSGRKDKSYDKILDKITNEAINNILPERLAVVKEHSDNDTICVICSASPIDYVENIAKYLGWEVVASNVQGDKVRHIHGKEKLIAILEKYPSGEYKYNFAMGDSQSDLFLMEKFETYQLV